MEGRERSLGILADDVRAFDQHLKNLTRIKIRYLTSGTGKDCTESSSNFSSVYFREEVGVVLFNRFGFSCSIDQDVDGGCSVISNKT